MKYCTKCGAEMLDEAVVCVKCGSPVINTQSFTQKIEKGNKKSLFLTATILNIIAFVVSMFCYFLIFYDDSNPTPPAPEPVFTITIGDGSTGYYGLTYAQLMNILAIVWIVLAISILLLGIIAVKKHSKIFTYIYLAFSYILLIAIFGINPNMLYMVICGLGSFFLAPTILQTIAGIKILRAINKDVE